MVGKREEKKILRGLILRALEGETSGFFADRLAQRAFKVGVDEILENEIEFTPTRIERI